jgi:DNA-binding CsgD family transcriptional regulator
MDQKRLARLTEQQRICLRHVYAHRTSKEIAPLMGIEPGSVDQHIKAAMRVLGVGDRRTAACLLAEHEQRSAAQLSAYPPVDLAIPADPVTFVPSAGGLRQSGFTGETLRENQAAFGAMQMPRAPMLPFPIGGTRPNDLAWPTRLAWIAGITIGVALAFGALVSGVEALVRLTAG